MTAGQRRRPTLQRSCKSSELLFAREMRLDLFALAPHRVQLLLRHERQLVREMRGARLAGISIADRALRALRSGEFDRTNERLAVRRVVTVAFLACVGDGPEDAGVARAS